jgi:hypothetical protein
VDQRYQELLRSSDEDLFLQGACHVFALALHERFEYVLVWVTASPSKGVAHVYCRLGEYAVDVMGFTPEKDILDAKQWNPPGFSVENVFRPEIEKSYILTPPCPGLYADARFMLEARNRADNRVRDYLKYFDGTCRQSIKPHPFLNLTSRAETERIFS